MIKLRRLMNALHQRKKLIILLKLLLPLLPWVVE
jgi:hypothetical protein